MHYELPVPVNPLPRNTIGHDKPIGSKADLLRELSDLARGNERGGAMMDLVARLNASNTSIWPDPGGSLQ
jgi:hypothetical protein